MKKYIFCKEFQLVYDKMKEPPDKKTCIELDKRVRELIMLGIWQKLDSLYMFGPNTIMGGLWKPKNSNDAYINWIHSATYIQTILKPKINYKIGDKVASETAPDRLIGKCTGFRHDDTCIDIDGKCWGGKIYFVKYKKEKK